MSANIIECSACGQEYDTEEDGYCCDDTTNGSHTMQSILADTSLYLNDDGRCTCARHAGAYLSAALVKNPKQHIISTPLGSWERFPENDLRTEGINCEECSITR